MLSTYNGKNHRAAPPRVHQQRSRVPTFSRSSSPATELPRETEPGSEKAHRKNTSYLAENYRNIFISKYQKPLSQSFSQVSLAHGQALHSDLTAWSAGEKITLLYKSDSIISTESTKVCENNIFLLVASVLLLF